MFSFGFSVYFGLDNSKEENIKLLKDAHNLGFTRIFTSLHIPEANYEVLKAEVKEFFEDEYEKPISTENSEVATMSKKAFKPCFKHRLYVSERPPF